MTRLVTRLSQALALIGGSVLAVVIVITVVSILGRSLNTFLHGDFAQSTFGGLADWLIAAGIGPIRGDFELVEAMMAFSIFAFLPLTQLTNGHAAVDIFTSWLPPRAQRVLLALIEILFAAVLIVIATQLKSGMDSKLRSGQLTFLLQFPLWWAYAASLVPAVIAALVGTYVALARIFECLSGRVILTEGQGAEH